MTIVGILLCVACLAFCAYNVYKLVVVLRERKTGKKK